MEGLRVDAATREGEVQKKIEKLKTSTLKQLTQRLNLKESSKKNHWKCPEVVM